MEIRDRIAGGLLFTDMGEGLPEERLICKSLVYDFNHTRPSDVSRRMEIINTLFNIGKNVWVEQPINCAYGHNVTFGDNCYVNMGLTLVDDYKINIGNFVAIGPNVTIATTGHPVHPDLRKKGEMFCLPVRIEDAVWIGAGAIVCPGVTIGQNSVIGAGSVVTKSIPSNVVAYGNPCKVMRKITDADKTMYGEQVNMKDKE